MPSLRHFAVRLGPRSAPILRLFGVRGQETAYVELSDTELVARFGWWEARTPVANIVSWRIEGPWRWITAIGVRSSIRHRDLSFAGSHRGGVRLDFREPIDVGRLHPPALYVSVEDLDGFAAALDGLGIPGEDARRDRPRA